MKISSKYTKKSSVQNYFTKRLIEGVKLIDLKKFSDCGGSFSEISRVVDGEMSEFPGFEIKQANYSEVLPGAIKAGHYHLKQDDVWVVPPSSRLLIGLMDLREDSPTYEAKQRFVMGDGKAQLLFIPKGFLHGTANVWRKPASLIYFVNQQFDPKNPDEIRLDYTVFGEGFWEIQKG